MALIIKLVTEPGIHKEHSVDGYARVATVEICLDKREIYDEENYLETLIHEVLEAFRIAKCIRMNHGILTEIASAITRILVQEGFAGTSRK